MASGEIIQAAFKDEKFYVEDIPVGGGIDALSAPTKRHPGTHEEVKNLLLDQYGSYISRNPFETLDVEDNITYTRAGPVNEQVTETTAGAGYARFVIPAANLLGGGAVDHHVRITHLFHYQRNDGRQCYIVVADNNSATAAQYACAVFKVNIDGTDPLNITPSQTGGGAEQGYRFFSQTYWDANGCRRDIYWDCTIYTDVQSGYDILVMTNGATRPLIWAPDDPELAVPIDFFGPGAGVEQECMTYMGYPVGINDWSRPDVATANTVCTTPGAGYLNGKYLYKCLWLVDSVGGGTQHRSPASLAFPSPAVAGAEDGIVATDEYVVVGAGNTLPANANAHLEIYRTKGDGRTFYYVDTLIPLAALYNDRVPDRDLKWEIPNIGDPPPAGFKYCDSYGARIWLANQRQTTAGALIASTGGQYANRIMYSDIGYPQSFRQDFSDLRVIHETKTRKNDPITGLYSREDYLLILCQDSVFRATGYDPLGWGSAAFDISCIDRKRGCSSHRTIVEDNDGGVYWLWQKELLKFDGYKVRRTARLSERILNQINIQQNPATGVDRQAMCCSVFYPHKGYQMLSYASTATDYPNRLLGFYPETNQVINFETRYTAPGPTIVNVSFSSMAETETPTGDFERIILGEALPAIGGYIYRWDQAAALSENNRDCHLNVPAGRQLTIQKEWRTDWLDQHKPWMRKKYTYLYLLCKTREDDVGGPPPVDNTRSRLDISAWMDGDERLAVPIFPDAADTDYPDKRVWVDRANHEYFEVMCDLSSMGVTLIGNMIKFRIRHLEQGIPIEFIKAHLFFTEFQRHDETKYALTP